MNNFLDKIAGNHRFTLLFLVCLSLFFFAGLGLVHLFDWDEINFAESAREMIATNDYMRVQINYISFWEKPPFFFWLQVLSMKLFGINEFAARFPNALFGLIYLLTFYYIGKKHFSQKFGILWALLFFGALLPHIYFKSGIIDPVFNYFIFMSLYFLLLVLGKSEENINRNALLSGIFSGLSVLTKGPVGFLLLGLTLLVYLVIKRFKPFPHIKYILIFFSGFLIIVCSWLCMELYQNGTENMAKFIEYQLGLFQSNVAGHEQPFYYHFVVVFFGCFPMSLLALPAFRRNTFKTPYNMRTWMLCLFWTVMIVFSITTTKIVHYSSMTYIPLSLLATLFIYERIEKNNSISNSLSAMYLIVGILLGTVFTAIPVLLENKEILYPYLNDPFAKDSLSTAVLWSGYELFIGVFFIAIVVMAYVFLRKGKLFQGIITSSAGTAITLLLVLLFIVPKIEAFTQGPAIKMYEELIEEDCYIETKGFKSYAQYYYGESSVKQKDIAWMLSSEKIDKPIYLVTKSNNFELDNHPNFVQIKKEGGFKLYKREF